MTETRAATLRRSVVLLFLASGFSGLVYQVAWVRLLTPVFGVSAFAISTVLAAFMGGLALGSYVFGRFIDHRRDPLRVYALLECGIGAYALLIPALFSVTNAVVRLVYHSAGEASPVVFGLFRACIAFLILVVPTTLMGATLPVLCKYFIESLDRVGRETGKLYFINTLGAVVGCVSAGFVLIPRFGLHVSIGIAAAINLLVGLVAYLIHRRARPMEISNAPVPKTDVLSSAPAARLSASLRWIVVAFGLSGMTALILEVLWTRVLVLIFGSTVYSFAAMLSVFLLGIALGGAVFGKIADRVRSPYRLFGVLQATIALIVLAEAATINYLPGLFLRLLVATGVQDSSLTLIKFVISFAILFPMTFLFGGTFPVVSKVFTDSLRKTGREIGFIYSMNTLGAIVGSLLGGFAIVPLVGIRHGLVVAAWVTLASGVVNLLIREAKERPRPLLAATFVATCIAGTLLLPVWNAALLAIPVWFQPEEYIGRDGKVDLDEVVRETKNLFYAEGLNDTIIVNENPTERILSINGKIIASTNWEDMLSLKMLGHLPVLIHPGKPRTALNIGLGIGGTVSGLASYDLQKVYGAELERKVVEANPLFAAVNGRILDNPQFQIVVVDGRNFMSLSDRTYDIIVSDPYDPFMTGAGILNSREHFELGRSRLNPDGILVQWVPLYQTSDLEYRSLLKTFASVFPHSTFWFAGKSVILVGSERRLVLDPGVLRARMAQPRAASDLKRLGMDTPERLLSFLLADERSFASYLANAPLNTDAFPFVEYASAWSILKKTTGSNFRAMREHFLPPDDVAGYAAASADGTRALDVPLARSLVEANRQGINGMVDYLDGRLEAAFRELTEAVARSRDPYLAAWLANMHERQGQATQTAGDAPNAMAHYEAAIRLSPDRLIGLANLGYLKLLAGDVVEARTLLERAYALFPTSAAIEMRLAAVCDAQGEDGRAQELLRSAVTHRPDLAMPLSMLALHHLNADDVVTAERLFRASLLKDPTDISAKEGLAQALLGQGRLDDSEKTCLALVNQYPERTTCRIFLGLIDVKRGDLPGAKAEFLSAIQANAAESEPYYQLARVEIAQGDRDGATRSLRRAIEVGGKAYSERASADGELRSLVSDASP